MQGKEVKDQHGLITEAPGVVKRPRTGRQRPAADAKYACSKCRTALAQVNIGIDKRCAACMVQNVRNKFSHAVKVQNALSNGDKVLVAVSGGPCSAALASLLQDTCSKSWERPERGKVMFEMDIVHIDESNALDGLAQHAWAAHTQDTAAVLCTQHTPHHAVHVVPLEDVFGLEADPVSRRQRLRRLMESIRDLTRRQDMLHALRMLLLQQTARRLGCNKLLLGESSSVIAARFVAAAAKGQGYAASGNLQLADAREGPSGVCIMRPLRDLSQKELALFVHFVGRSFRVAPQLADSHHKTSINDLADGFVAALHGQNPGALATVMRTASKLEPFEFNNADLAPPPPLADQVPRARGWRHDDEAAKAAALLQRGTRAAAVPLCPLCRSPFHPLELQSAVACFGGCLGSGSGYTGLAMEHGDSGDPGKGRDLGRALLCEACSVLVPGSSMAAACARGQDVEAVDALDLPEVVLKRSRQLGSILAADAAGEEALKLVPEAELRAQVADCLLSDPDT